MSFSSPSTNSCDGGSGFGGEDRFFLHGPGWGRKKGGRELLVAQFAVRIYALSTKELKMQLLSVISGETQPCDGGYNYRLVITVTGGKKTQYDAFVWGILGTMSWKLWSFTPHV
ncbi:uncharacterized protein LOC101775697 [Setaria italica]|uniref:uncharacterized protein LOC101775697 n=1 Tax=Setaria italica TaxID=4555 RepID=UPI000BE50920|nr:uncharacterized protein LOC101775697 [Setaria italica]